ncbi:MAG: hypothetical protein A2958_00910 [Candidatus Levybacteria bacterium RIFCSPLOWO2_01_FULL_38_13]|nr:MAG: hypothetical protein A2629_00805 [Candidatus Levybacteria bacterium RIFCSPHIGHO2_01_FULL_41_15]OGH34847.1 MAG: hypothetical protein A2958_00910 [Candidatus Levybacteria bacterium RIFCSPLOWO2_01_FULL_38_13]
MSLRHAERELSRMGIKGIARAISGLRQELLDKHGISDVPLPEGKGEKEKVESYPPDPLDLLRRAAQELNRNPFSPEKVTNFQKAFWQVPRGEEGLTFDIAPCSATEERLKKPFADIKGIELSPFTIGIPEELKGKEGLITLGKMFPELENYSVREGTPIEDEFDRTGYIRVEGVIDSPNLDTNEDQLRKHFELQGTRGQRLITYAIFSRQMEVLDGNYLDQGSTWSRLLGSRIDGRVVYAYCYPYGYLYVFRGLYPQNRHPDWGGRSEEVL